MTKSVQRAQNGLLPRLQPGMQMCTNCRRVRSVKAFDPSKKPRGWTAIPGHALCPSCSWYDNEICHVYRGLCIVTTYRAITEKLTYQGLAPVDVVHTFKSKCGWPFNVARIVEKWPEDVEVSTALCMLMDVASGVIAVPGGKTFDYWIVDFVLPKPKLVQEQDKKNAKALKAGVTPMFFGAWAAEVCVASKCVKPKADKCPICKWVWFCSPGCASSKSYSHHCVPVLQQDVMYKALFRQVVGRRQLTESQLNRVKHAIVRNIKGVNYNCNRGDSSCMTCGRHNRMLGTNWCLHCYIQ